MAGANVSLEGYPFVYRMKMHQGSSEAPGKLIVEAVVVGPENLQNIPKITKLTAYSRNFSGVWDDVRVARAPRVRRGYMRIVLEDSRWKLRETFLKENYNERDSLGNVMTGCQKTIPELATILSDASGLNISATAAVVPSFNPRAKWAGVRADHALKQLLRDTGCRMVYNPVDQTYKISLCGTGDPPDVTDRIFRPGPIPEISEVIIKTSPILYEDTLDVTAIRINTSTGEAEALPTPVSLPDSPTEAYGQTRLRLWKPSSIDHPALSGASGTNMVVDGVDDTKVTPDSYTPTDSDVGRVVRITGGTGWTTGDYIISSHDGTQWTLESSPAVVTTSGGEWTLVRSDAEILLLDHRAKTHLFDPDRPTHERARIVRDEWDPFPHHEPLYAPDSDASRLIELTGGGRAFLTDHPVLMTNATGVLLTEAKLVTSYYVKEGQGLERDSKSIAIPGSGSRSLEITVPWIKPVDSTLPDMATSAWSTLLDDVAVAVAHRFNYLGNKPETIRLSNPIDLKNSGQVGAVEYDFQVIHNRPRIYFQVALNFDPGSVGNIR